MNRRVPIENRVHTTRPELVRKKGRKEYINETKGGIRTN